jgi:hypothetical protein
MALLIPKIVPNNQIADDDNDFLDLLPSQWFKMDVMPMVIGRCYTVAQHDKFVQENPTIIHYDKPIDPRVAMFLGLSLHDKLVFLKAYDSSTIFRPNEKYVDDILLKDVYKKKRYELLCKKCEEIDKKDEKKKKRKKPIPKALKSSVWIKCIGKEVGMTKCLCCEINDISQLNFECGHVLAEANGGQTCLENLRPICSTCNRSMGTMHMDEFKRKFFKDEMEL